MIEVSREMTMRIFKVVWGSWPKFEHVTRKVPTPRTLHLLLAFDKKSTFNFFDLFAHIKRASLYWIYNSIYLQIEKKKSNVDFSSKAKSCTVHYFAVLILVGTVAPQD